MVSKSSPDSAATALAKAEFDDDNKVHGYRRAVEVGGFVLPHSNRGHRCLLEKDRAGNDLDSGYTTAGINQGVQGNVAFNAL
jgi:hypothetical protein